MLGLSLFITGCTKQNSSSVVKENKNIYISEKELFDIKTPHFCYIFLDECSACASITEKMELYASEHNDFYMLKAPLNYSKGFNKYDCLGATSFTEISFVGFPTLIHIVDQTLDQVYVGVNEICNVLY